MIPLLLFGIFVFLLCLFFLKKMRLFILSGPVMRYLQRALPPMSQTEKEAIEAGDIWWEAELFRGKPDWYKLLDFPQPRLTEAEQAFLNNEVETLCSLLNDWKIVQEDHDLPPAVWDYLKEKRFLGMVIPPEYGGLGFSAFAHSSVIVKIATRSLSAAVNTMVPNSLGPGELLLHYGTQVQKEYYLPRLATGQEIPCFALTGVEAGSDAGSMTDKGIVCYGEHEGQKTLGIQLNWNKRYITLAPMATLIGLAFKLFDPDNLLGDKKEIGITVCLIPAHHSGVKIGRRHYPLNLAFMNGPIQGENVFIPMDWVIGGQAMVGQGWRMLMECLSIGRGISLPALGTAGAILSYRMTGAYARLRKQFKVSLAEFEGIQQALARIAGYTYLVQACRYFTVSAVDAGIKPAIASAIAKYHSSEANRKIYQDAMDVHGGKAIQGGPLNYLAHGYYAIPVGITVEGANILTRNLMIFGQGAIRCHPYLLTEMQAAQANDVASFDTAFRAHAQYLLKNVGRSIRYALTGGRFIQTPNSPFAAYYRQLTRMSTALAVTADLSMILLGGALKRKEALSARLGDVLSYLYLASAVLKYQADEGMEEDQAVVEWVLIWCLSEIQAAFLAFFQNFPYRFVAFVLKKSLFFWRLPYAPPTDKLIGQLAKSMSMPSSLRERLTRLCYLGRSDQPLRQVEEALLKWVAVLPLKHKKEPLTPEEIQQLQEADAARLAILQVDDFPPEYFTKRS